MIQKIVYIKNVLSNKIFLFSACDLSILLQMVYRLLVFYCLTDCKSSWPCCSKCWQETVEGFCSSEYKRRNL